jgi:putative ABC transport system permease protein
MAEMNWWRRRRERDLELERELRSHLEAEAAEQQEQGLTPEDARYGAHRALVNTASITENVHAVWGGMWLERLFQDARFGLRTLRKDRGFAALAVSALALGIGAATVIFSVIDNVLLEPFPYEHAERLTKFYIHDFAHPEQTGRSDFLMAEYRTFKDQNRVFEDIIATKGLDVLYTDKAGTKLFRGYETTANTFDFFGVKPLLGRAMTPADGRPDAPPIAVISYRAWRGEFGGDLNIVGTLLTLNGQPTTLISVMPPRFALYDGDFWLPLAVERPETRVNTLGRLKRDVSLRAAASDLNVIARGLAKIYPGDYPPKFNISTVTLVDRVLRRFRPLLYALTAAVIMLLLIACSNVANLLLARATAREHEIAVRASLGASRIRLIAQLMVESFLLACLGCAAGSLLAYAGIWGVATAMPRDLIPNESVIVLNWRVMLFALGLAVITTLLCGLAPALHAIGRDLHGRVKAVGKGTGTVARHSKLRTAFVVSQVALSIVLLVGAGLMMRSLLALQSVDLGFTPDHVLTVRIPFPRGRYDTAQQKRVFFQPVLGKISALPGVVAAAEVSALPPYGGPRSEVTVPGKAGSETLHSNLQLSSEGLFKTLGIRLLRGRLLSESDVDSARQVIVVNQTLVNKFFPTDDPIGRSIKFNLFDDAPESPRNAYFEIVGVVADARNNGLQQAPQPEAFLPYTASGIFGRGIVVRTAVNPSSLLPSIQSEIWAADPAIAPTLAGTLESFLERDAYSQPRFALIVLGLFASIGLLLAAIGIFSVLAYSVSLQTREIGIRMALGAERGAVLKMVLRSGLTMIGAGIVIGELASFGLTQFLQNQIWGVSARDPVTLAAVVAVLVAVGVAACIVPARRATRVDPVVALRYE